MCIWSLNRQITPVVSSMDILLLLIVFIKHQDEHDHTHTHKCTYLDGHLRANIVLTHIHSVDAYARTRTEINTHAHTNILSFIHTRTNMQAHKYTHIHTYTHAVSRP